MSRTPSTVEQGAVATCRLLVHRWLTTVNDGYKHDGGEETARALLALLDYLASIKETEGLILLTEPPPVGLLPEARPLEINLRSDTLHLKKSVRLTMTTRYNSSFVALTGLAAALADALRRGIALSNLVRTGSRQVRSSSRQCANSWAIPLMERTSRS